VLKSSVRTNEAFVIKAEEWAQVVGLNEHYSIAIRIRIRPKGSLSKEKEVMPYAKRKEKPKCRQLAPCRILWHAI